MCVQYVLVSIFNTKTSYLCQICCKILLHIKTCLTTGYNLTVLKVTERYKKKICCIARIVSYVREMKTKVENFCEISKISIL